MSQKISFLLLAQSWKCNHFDICQRHTVIFTKACPQRKRYNQRLTDLREGKYSIQSVLDFNIGDWKDSTSAPRIIVSHPKAGYILYAFHYMMFWCSGKDKSMRLVKKSSVVSKGWGGVGNDWKQQRIFRAVNIDIYFF